MDPAAPASRREVHSPHQAPAGLDARLQRLAKENGFRHWHRVARQMPRCSSGQCRDRLARDVYHRPPVTTTTSSPASTTASAAPAGRTSAGAVYGRSSRVMKRRWRDLRKSDTFLRKMWRPLPAADQEDVRMDADLDSPASSSQHAYTGILASAVASCSLSRDTVGSGFCTSLALGLTCMAV